ncbi:hypothetical protein FD754_014168, partial [Muntiacus muntjak]
PHEYCSRPLPTHASTRDSWKIKLKNIKYNTHDHNVCPSSCPLNQQCYPTISSSASPFFSCYWSSTALSLSNETCQRAGHLKVDDQCLLMSQSTTKNQSTSTEFGQIIVTDTVKTNIAAVFLVGNSMLHDLCQSQVPENKESEQGLSAELDLEMISEEEQEKLDGIGNNHSQKMCIKQGKLEWTDKLKAIRNELKQKFGEICEKYKITVCPEEDPPSFPEQKEPSLENVFPLSVNFGSLGYACQSPSKLCFTENKVDIEKDQLDIEHMFIKIEESFNNDTENKKVGDLVVTFEVKEDQEFDMQMLQNMRQNPTNWKLDIGQTHHKDKSMEPELENGSSLPKSHRTSKVYVNEGLQKDMQRFKNEIDMLQVELLALEEENSTFKRGRGSFALALVEGEQKHQSREVEVPDNEYDAADESGLKSGRNSNQECTAMENERFDSTGPAGKSLNSPLLYLEVKERIDYVNHLDDLPQSSENDSEDDDVLYSMNSMLQVEPLGLGCKDSVSLLKIRDTILSYERSVALNKSHCELLRGKIKKMESKVSGLQKELSETKEVKSQLEHQKVDWEREFNRLRFTLKQEEENRRNANMLYEKMREQLRRKEDEYSKEVEVTQRLALTFRALEMKLKMERSHPNQRTSRVEDLMKRLQLTHIFNFLLSRIITANELIDVSDSCEDTKALLLKKHMLQDEIAMLRLQRDAVKNQHRAKEENYFEDIEILKVKNDDLQKAVKLTEETLTQTISHGTGQLNALTAENTMPNSKLENKKESKQRLETEVKSYRSRLAAALHDHDQGQTSKRDVELAFQRAKEEWLCLQDKMESDVAHLKENNEMLSQQLSEAESEFNKLKIKLHYTRDDLREKTLTLERVQRDLSQVECQKQKIEHMYHKEQGKLSKYIGKQESLEERLSQLQSENMLLRQQLDDAQKRADSKEKTVISIQDQFQQIVGKLQAESEKQGLMLEERNEELINECNHLKERMHQYKNEKAEGEVNRNLLERSEHWLEYVKISELIKASNKKGKENVSTLFPQQLRQELDDTVKKLSMSDASLKDMSWCRVTLEAEARDLKNKFKVQLCQLTSQVCRKLNGMFIHMHSTCLASMDTRSSEPQKSYRNEYDNSNKAGLEKYKQLYLEECEVRKSLEDKLDKQQGSLWAHLPFSLTPILSSPRGDLLPGEPQRRALL